MPKYSRLQSSSVLESADEKFVREQFQATVVAPPPLVTVTAVKLLICALQFFEQVSSHLGQRLRMAAVKLLNCAP